MRRLGWWFLALGLGTGTGSAAAGPVAAWSFNEGSGQVARDSSGNGLDATLRGAAGWSPGVDGAALALNGTGYAEVAVDPRLQLGPALTIEAWFRPTALEPDTFKHIVSLWDSYLLRLDNPPEGNRLSFFTFLEGDPEPRLSAGVPALDQWHQIFAVWTGTNMDLWVDGSRRTRPRTGAPAPQPRSLRLGENFIGLIDEVRIYDRALTRAEITSRIPPRLVSSLQVGRPLAPPGEPFPITCTVSNTGGQALTQGTVTLQMPLGVELVAGAKVVPLPEITHSNAAAVTWQLRANAPLREPVRATVEFAGGQSATHEVLVAVGHLPPFDDRFFAEPSLVQTEGGDLILGNAKLRLVFARNPFGYGIYAVDARQGAEWRRVALANALSQLSVMDGGRPRSQMIHSPGWEPLADVSGEAGIAFTSTWTDGAGTAWSGRFTFRLGTAERVQTRMELVPDRPAALARLQGPTLYAGEGSFGAAKDDALFGGIEWLVDQEASSSDIDMHDPEHYLRFVPHPNKITVPLMGVAGADAALALLWDPRQTWDGQHDRPAAVFASPNFLDGQENHLLGLFLPSVPQWIEPNHRDATANPYPAAAGNPLRLEAWIVARAPAAQTLDCLPHWFDVYGLPDRAPLPRGSYPGEIDFSTRAFLESLWVETEQKWWTTKGGGPLLSRLGLPHHFAYQLRLAALLTADDARRDAYHAQAARTESLGGFRPAWDDFGLTWANATDGLLQHYHRAVNQLNRLGPDGAWRFEARIETEGIFAGRDYGLLGPDGATEVGLCARPAYEILRYARLFGDDDAFAAVQPALEFMRQFRVPRAAQVWECPVHAPDILAAADAVEAYLEAYRFSGDRAFLDDAVYWAHAGLPFVYLWNPTDLPMVRYASIAILGGSWHEGSWIGQPVQWNGLRYAYALLKLAAHDATQPWRRIAEGLTVSALLQQEPDGPDVALWPDNISALDGSKCPWVFEPGMILKNILHLIDRELEPDTEVVPPGFRLTSRARLSHARFAEGTLRVTAQFPEPESGQIVIAGATRPAEVRLGGVPLAPAAGDVWGISGPTWRYDAGPSLVTIKLTNSGPHTVEATGIAHRPVRLIPPLTRAIAFDFETGPEGWLPANQIDDWQVQDGLWRGTATGGDPYIHRLRVRVNGDACSRVGVRARATAGYGLALYWLTEDSPTWAEDKVLRLPFVNRAEFREYVFPVGQHPQWAGHTVTALRLDPLEGGAGGQFEIDYIRGDAAQLRAGAWSGQGFQLWVQGIASARYRVEATTNLVVWESTARFAEGSATHEYLDPAALHLPQRFYRAIAE